MKFYSNGKLLITGEYAVLDGAKALAIPTKFGQYLTVDNLKNTQKGMLHWQSVDEKGITWFQCELKLTNFELKSIDSETIETRKIAITLQTILREVRKLNPEFLTLNKSIHVKTTLNFSRNWGLGTSSTLINNIAKWANVDAFKLQFNTFGGSAYDIACAQNNSPILYQLKNDLPLVNAVKFNPNFKEHLFFVYLNKKKNSREAIENYRKFNQNKNELILEISKLTDKFCAVNTLNSFEELILTHEEIIANAIKIKPIKKQLFNDYFGQVKSLGAWEGDFVLATGNSDTPNYFKSKGFEIVIPFTKMIL